MLKCGHVICNECTSKTQKGSIKCKTCGSRAEATEASAVAANALFQAFLSQLTDELKEKYKKALDIYNGLFLFKI